MPIYICAILLMIAADQAVKYWAFTSLQAQQTIPLINGVLYRESRCSIQPVRAI